jgi:hypothetical protein
MYRGCGMFQVSERMPYDLFVAFCYRLVHFRNLAILSKRFFLLCVVPKVIKYVFESGNSNAL